MCELNTVSGLRLEGSSSRGGQATYPVCNVSVLPPKAALGALGVPGALGALGALRALGALGVLGAPGALYSDKASVVGCTQERNSGLMCEVVLKLLRMRFQHRFKHRG